MAVSRIEFPDEDELVLCTVTAVQAHSVFVVLDEYDKRTGLIHISEIAPGRIRNIREYVEKGKKIVCKVLRVNREKGHIDLSLRRVSAAQKRQKLDDIKRAQFAESIVKQVAKKLKKEPLALIALVIEKAAKSYDSLFDAFEDVALRGVSFEKLGIEETIANELDEAVKSKIKPPRVEIKGNLKIVSYAPDGIDVVKGVLGAASSTGGSITIKYMGAGAYHVVVSAAEYKDAEKVLKESLKRALEFAKKKKAIAEFVRAEEA